MTEKNYLSQVWNEEQKKMDAFFDGMDAKIAAAEGREQIWVTESQRKFIADAAVTIAAQAARIAELEARVKDLEATISDLIWVIDNGDFDEMSIGAIHADMARDLLAKKV